MSVVVFIHYFCCVCVSCWERRDNGGFVNDRLYFRYRTTICMAYFVIKRKRDGGRGAEFRVCRNVFCVFICFVFVCVVCPQGDWNKKRQRLRKSHTLYRKVRDFFNIYIYIYIHVNIINIIHFSDRSLTIYNFRDGEGMDKPDNTREKTFAI